MGPQAVAPDAAHEGRVAARVAEGDDLVVERGQPEVWVIAEARSQVGHEGLDRVGSGTAPDTGLAFTADIGADRLAIALEVAGDGRDRPAPLVQCVDLHVFSLCEHGAGLLRCCGFGTVSIVGAPFPYLDGPVGGQVHVLRGGEFQ